MNQSGIDALNARLVLDDQEIDEWIRVVQRLLPTPGNSWRSFRGVPRISRHLGWPKSRGLTRGDCGRDAVFGSP